LLLALLARSPRPPAAPRRNQSTSQALTGASKHDGYLGAPAFVTQNWNQFNLVTETGESFRAWPDVTAPASRIWIDARNESAVYSPDGMRIQFDDGRVWQRDLGPLPPPPGNWRRARASVAVAR
jgi:hypothetical protein